MSRKAEGETPEGRSGRERRVEERAKNFAGRADANALNGRNLAKKTLAWWLWSLTRDERKALLRGDDGGMSTGYAAITSQSEEERDVTHRFLRDRTVEL